MTSYAQNRHKPRLFIGSSTEGLIVANSMQELLTDAAEVTVWDQAAFELSVTVFEGLVKATESFDCAAFVFSPSDVATIRDRHYSIVRDNVLFEIGLFCGHLGRERCFIVQPAGESLRLPSDLLGLVIAQYESTRLDGNIVAALGPACNRIRRQLPVKASLHIKPLQAAIDRLSQANDPLFVDLAATLMSDQAKLIADGSVGYIIALHPDCLRSSIERARTQVRATYFVERASDAEYLLGRKMLSWLEYNGLVASRPGMSFKRLLVIRDDLTHVQRYWRTIEDVCSRQARADVYVRLLNGDALFDPTLASEDFVVVDDSRLHTHAPKLESGVPYTTAKLSIALSDIARRTTQWDRMWNDAIEWPTDLTSLFGIAH